MTPPTKNPKPKTTKFSSLQTRRLAESFEGLQLSSKIDWRVMELLSGAKLALCVISKYNILVHCEQDWSAVTPFSGRLSLDVTRAVIWAGALASSVSNRYIYLQNLNYLECFQSAWYINFWFDIYQKCGICLAYFCQRV